MTTSGSFGSLSFPLCRNSLQRSALLYFNPCAIPQRKSMTPTNLNHSKTYPTKSPLHTEPHYIDPNWIAGIQFTGQNPQSASNRHKNEIPHPNVYNVHTGNHVYRAGALPINPILSIKCLKKGGPAYKVIQDMAWLPTRCPPDAFHPFACRRFLASYKGFY